MTFRYRCLGEECLKNLYEFDFLHVPKDEPAKCPRCSGRDVEKVFAPSVAIVVNGASAANNYGLKPTRRKK